MWTPASSPPRRPEGPEVDLWWIDLAVPDDVVASLRQFLSGEEIQRAERFHFARHRRRFTVRRAALRRLLGTYLGMPPEDVEFETAERGKPSLAGFRGKPKGRRLEFNLSDSADAALVAVTTGAEVGVDIELMNPSRDLTKLAHRFFADSEVEDLLGLPPSDRPAGFFRAWTRKEAALKAIGTGLGGRIESCVVSLRPAEPTRLIRLPEGHGDPADWSLLHLDAPEAFADFLGALAVARREVELRRWTYSAEIEDQART